MSNVDTVLLYAPKGSKKVLRMKPALVRCKARIKMVSQEQFSITIGELLGMTEEEIEEIASSAVVAHEDASHNVLKNPEELEGLKQLQEEVLVLWNFSNAKIDEMLYNFKKAGVSRVSLKAVVTPNNIRWTFAQLIYELQKEDQAYRS